MAWGYERGFVIEHNDTLKKRIDCKSCCYYDRHDKSWHVGYAKKQEDDPRRHKARFVKEMQVLWHVLCGY